MADSERMSMDFMRDKMNVVRNYGKKISKNPKRPGEKPTSTSRLTHTRNSLRRNVVMRLSRSGEAANWDGEGHGLYRVKELDATCYGQKRSKIFIWYKKWTSQTLAYKWCWYIHRLRVMARSKRSASSRSCLSRRPHSRSARLALRFGRLRDWTGRGDVRTGGR